MPIVDIQWNPTDRQVRQFSTISLVAVPLLAWLSTHDSQKAQWAACVGAALCAGGWAAPRLIRPLFVALSVVTAPIGMVIGELTLMLIFFSLVTPIGLLLRLLGKDPIDKRPDPASATYWEEHPRTSDVAKYYRQF